ncbi:MAG: tRNA dimethylallyltransferase, partial [Alphaproteobacteria bacterium]|nr:tRNA dimethylallyltransferase [Alphaproteobacteria bacterium]
LYGACDERFWRMMEDGLMDEVRALDARGLDPSLPVMKAVGLREMLRHCHGEISLEEAVSLAQRSTRRYAKRQMTWLRHQLDHGKMESMIIEDLYEKTQLPEIFSFLHRFLLSQE